MNYQAQIDALIPKAETGEQWAEICRLEALMIAEQENKALKQDCLTLALRLYGEDESTFAPETAEVMARWRVQCAEVLAS